MPVEPIWTVQELSDLSGALTTLEEFLQEWEQDNNLKIGDILINLDTLGRNSTRVGLVSFRSMVDTTLQFEALDAEIGIA